MIGRRRPNLRPWALAATLAGIALVEPARADRSASAEDRPVPARILSRLVTGRHVLIGQDEAVYGRDGSYSFAGAHQGRYRIGAGRICVDFESGQARCDRVVQDAGRFYLITAQGRRFPFRPVDPDRAAEPSESSEPSEPAQPFEPDS